MTKLGKMLLTIVCLVLISGIAQAKVKHGGKVAGDTVLVIPKTSIAPVVDGVADPIWNLVDATWMEYALPQNGNYPADWSDISGWFKLMYDDKNIYGLYYVQDDVIDTTTTIDWQLDGVEFYIDANNTHEGSSQLVAPKFQFNLRPAQKIDSVEQAIGRGLKYRWMLDTTSINHSGPIGYFVEFKFSLDSLGFTTPVQAGKKVSVQFQLDDNDLTADGRIHVMNWWPSFSNTDYLQTLNWGNAIFDGTVIDTKYVFLKTPTPPVIDGKTDAVWDQANQASLVYVQPQNGANPQDQDWRFYGLYDDHNIYGLFTVYDDVIDTTTTIDWQLDGVEFYSDVNNTHVASSQLVAPKYQVCLRPAQKIDSAQSAIGKGLKYAWTVLANDPNDTVFSSRAGWQLEFKLSLDSLGFTTPAAEGKVFSFQLQTDDNDLTDVGRVHTANWWYSPLNQDYLQTLDWGDAKLGPLIVTGVKDSPSPVAYSFRLEQNYPNPFNPTTQINYSIDRKGYVILKVYNVLGQEVATLFSGVRNAGNYTATFSGDRLSSGVYFYTLHSPGQNITKKMVLLK